MQQLGSEIRVTSDLGRSYKCIVKRRGYYTMEDWLAFTEVFSLFLLRHNDILDPVVRSAGVLRSSPGYDGRMYT